jgi:hypothetical protein
MSETSKLVCDMNDMAASVMLNYSLVTFTRDN